MRRVSSLAVVLGLLVWGVAAPAHGDSAPDENPQAADEDAEPSVDGRQGLRRNTFEVEGRSGNQGNEGSRPARRATPVSDGPPPPPPEDITYEPNWGTHPETGEPCIELTRVVRPGVANSSLAADYEHRLLTMMGDQRLREVEHNFCRDRAEDEGGESPAAIAQAFVRSLGIPAPEPRIDPGWALTGMPAYLEIHGQEAFTHDEQIPGFGQLRVSFEPTYFEIDWGDGTTRVVDDGRTGAPYDGPESQQISHTYADVDGGNVVRVDARWHATWRLAGFSGVVGGLQTSEEFPLEVREMQSVRTS
jgi:hypothetical protein